VPDTGGDDVILTGDGDDVVLGGVGTDYVNMTIDPITGDPVPVGTDTGDDVIVGDNGLAVFDTTSGSSILTDIETTDPVYGADDYIYAGEGNDTVLGGSGNDYVDAGTDAGTDIVVGDNGIANFDTAGNLTDVTTTVPDTGGDDVILTGDGDDVVLGGVGTDYVNMTIDPITGDPVPVGTDTGDDVIVGDNGLALFDTTSGQSVLTLIETTYMEYGSDDFLFGDGGSDAILGGKGNDTIIAGTGNDTVLGDNGDITYTEGIISQVISSDMLLATAGDDNIFAGEGNDMVIAGIGNDLVDGADGDDVLLGDNGQITLEGGLLTLVTSIPSDVGGNDVISGGNGGDILIGGESNDTLLGGSDFDILFGDNGLVRFLNGKPWIAETMPFIGGDVDYLDGGEGTDVLFGGEGTDAGVGEFPTDALIGEYGQVIIENGKVIRIYPPIDMLFGNPISQSDGHAVSAMEDIIGPVLTKDLLFIETGPGFMAITEPGLSGFYQAVTRHASYGQSYGLAEEEPSYAGRGIGEGMPPGEELTEITLPDGSVERRFQDGSVETTRPDGTVITRLSDGTVIVGRPNGTMIMTSPDGTKTATLPDGTIIKTLPDGTIITTMPDGRVIRTLSDGTSEIITGSDTVSDNSDIKEMRYGEYGPEDRFTEDLKNDSAFDIDSGIELGALVAGLGGWGMANLTGSGNDQSILDREGFERLEYEAKLRRFLRWREGRFMKYGKGNEAVLDRKKLH
jgi:Ca2+-binding RTX toxin-like protein